MQNHKNRPQLTDADANKAYVNGYIISVDAYIEMMDMAKNMAMNGRYFDTDCIAQGNILSKRIVDCVDKAVCKKYKKYSSSDVISGEAARDKYAYFVMGMALHTLGDLYAHQSYGLFEKSKYYYKKKKVVSIPSVYTHIIHVKKNKDGSFYDNRADCGKISPNRIEYTKKLYNNLISKYSPMGSADAVAPSACDYYCVSTDAVTNSTKLYKRVKDMDNHFGINEFSKYVSSSGGNCKNIDLESLYEQYSKWNSMSISVDSSFEECRVEVYKHEINGTEDTYKKIADSNDKSLMLKKKNKYSFICDSGVLYVVRISAKKDKKKVYLTKQFKLADKEPEFKVKTLRSSDGSSSLMVHHKKTEVEYDVLKKVDKVSQINLIQNKEIRITKTSFKTANLSGEVRDEDQNNDPLEGVEITLTDHEGKTYSCSSDASGDYLMGDSFNLYPDVYTFIARKEGYIDIEGEVIVRSEVNNRNPILHMQRISTGKCKNISGYVKDAETGDDISGLKVCLCKGVRIKGDACIEYVETDQNGRYCFKDIDIGTYTVYVTDERKVEKKLRYLDYFVDITAKAGQEVSEACYVSRTLGEEKIRIILKWGKTPRDLDSHLYLYDKDIISKHCYYMNTMLKEGDKTIVSLDKDDTNGNGCETITVSEKNIDFLYSVYDYSNDGMNVFKTSGITVTVYNGNSKPLKITPPKNASGYTWDVFKYSNKKIDELKKVY